MADKGTPTTNAADGDLKLTTQETKLFTHIIKQLPKTIDIDWDQVAAEVGFKNGDVAKTRCRQIRTKLGIYGSSAGSPRKPAASNPIKPINKGNKVVKPRKNAKAKESKPAVEIANHDDDDDDDDDNDGDIDDGPQEGEI
ncbi:hypothetical protein F4859DRAFT_11213 [Xylaria cf. heliscus]|nr:hypothetical protein F4859DRAFT_11213 [Xylaria cf. heliscus]